MNNRYEGKRIKRKRQIGNIFFWVALLVSGLAFGPLTKQEISEAEKVILIGAEPMDNTGPVPCYACHLPR